MSRARSIRSLIARDEDEVLVYGSDNFPQYPSRTPSVVSRCDRALAAADSRDVVVLRGTLDRHYHRWLRSLGLGTEHIVEYEQPPTGRTLSELIIDDPQPVLRLAERLGRESVYVPWFAGSTERRAADTLEADLFGASASLTKKYNDKGSFKRLCQGLGIPVVEGSVLSIQASGGANFAEMARLVTLHRSQSDTVIVRGTLGLSGMSLFKTQGDGLLDLYERISDSGEPEVLIEPFLDVSSSPSDQWVIDRDGEAFHVGLLEQQCAHGMVHVGNLKGPESSGKTLDAITRTSATIAAHMAASGYCGVVGIDYVVCGASVFPVENNARFNGSTYVHMLVDRVEEQLGPVPYWKFMKLQIPPCSFAQLAERLSSVLYDGKVVNSVFPINCEDLARTGSLALVFLAQDMDGLVSLQNTLESLGIELQQT